MTFINDRDRTADGEVVCSTMGAVSLGVKARALRCTAFTMVGFQDGIEVACYDEWPGPKTVGAGWAMVMAGHARGCQCAMASGLRGGPYSRVTVPRYIYY